MVPHRRRLWGAGDLSPALAPRLKGISRADSIAFDFHKWGQVPYDAGFLLVRDGRQHYETSPLRRPICAGKRADFRQAAPGPAISARILRGFRALKTWFTLKVHGGHAIGASIRAKLALAKSCRLASKPNRRWNCWLAPSSISCASATRVRSGPHQCRNCGGSGNRASLRLPRQLLTANLRSVPRYSITAPRRGTLMPCWTRSCVWKSANPALRAWNGL